MKRTYFSQGTRIYADSQINMQSRINRWTGINPSSGITIWSGIKPQSGIYTTAGINSCPGIHSLTADYSKPQSMCNCRGESPQCMCPRRGHKTTRGVSITLSDERSLYTFDNLW